MKTSRVAGARRCGYQIVRSLFAWHLFRWFPAKTLTRATKRLLGQTPKQVIDARVTYAAIRLLANTDISVNWISTKLGFSQQSNFAKFFCRQVDMTPAAYREACLSSGTMFPVNNGSSFT